MDLDLAEDGSVASSTIREGSELFGRAARLGVMNWRFRPARRNGVAIRSGISVRIRFEEPLPVIPALDHATAQSLPEDLLGSDPVDEIVVRAERPTEIGATSIDSEEARQIPGAFADPFRVAEVLPGIAPILSGLPYFVMRGASPGNVAYLVDGIRVPLLFHVGAGPSVIAPSLVERVEVIPSAYPARFGRSAGGIIAGETLPLSPVARGQFQARLFDASALVEVPFAESRASLLVAGRYSYVQPLLDRVSPEYELAYWDYQSRAGVQLNGSDTLSLFAFGASDQLESRLLQRELFDTQFHRLDLRWDRTTEGGKTRIAITGGSDRVATAEEDAVPYAAQHEERSLRLRWETDQRLAPDVNLRTGMDYGANQIITEQDTQASAVAFSRRIDQSASAYLDMVLRGPGVEVVPGIRTEAGTWRKEPYVFLEPRLAARLRLFSGLSWVSQFGISHQLPSQSVHIPGHAPDPVESSVQEVWQVAQGVEFLLSSSLLGAVTAFHSRVISNALDRSDRGYGVEASLHRDFTERLGAIISYTLARTEATSGRDTIPSQFDRTHVISAVLGWNIGAGFKLGLRGYYASGRPYEVECPTPSCSPGDPAAPLAFLIRRRLPEFYRADFRFEKRWEMGYAGWIAVTLEWFNATLSSETTGVEWLPVSGLVFSDPERLSLPSIGLEGGF